MVYKQALVHIFWILEPQRVMRINEGAAGLAAACFSPDSQYVLTSLYYGVSIMQHFSVLMEIER